MSGFRKLEKLAIEVAVDAPAKGQQRYASDAKISWHIVNAIRAELDAKGIDWRAMADQVAELKLERRAKWQREMGERFRREHSREGA